MTPREAGPGASGQEAAFVTGFPGFVAQRLVERLVDDGSRIFLLVGESHRGEAERFVERLRDERGSAPPITLLRGNITHLDLGLTGQEIQQLQAEVTVVHHLEHVYHLGNARRRLFRVNVEGTRAMLGLAEEFKALERFCFYSTAVVAGRRQGVILESELESHQRFHNLYEESRFRAERLVRRCHDRLPISIFRPSILVGVGPLPPREHLSGPHLLLSLFINLPPSVPLPLPGQGHFPLNLVPVDYVVEAATRLSRDPRALGLTFHLTDPNPLSVRGVLNLTSDLANRPRPLDAAANLLPYRLAHAALSLPVLQRRARGALQLLDALHSLAIYNRMNTDAILGRRGGPRCPPFPSYAEALVGHIRRANAPHLDLDLSADDFH